MVDGLDLVLGKINQKWENTELGKSRFLEKEIDFLGHRIGRNGIQPTKKEYNSNHKL
jgi:hypothetical protein